MASCRLVSGKKGWVVGLLLPHDGEKRKNHKGYRSCPQTGMCLSIMRREVDWNWGINSRDIAKSQQVITGTTFNCSEKDQKRRRGPSFGKGTEFCWFLPLSFSKPRDLKTTSEGVSTGLGTGWHPCPASAERMWHNLQVCLKVQTPLSRSFWADFLNGQSPIRDFYQTDPSPTEKQTTHM